MTGCAIRLGGQPFSAPSLAFSSPSMRALRTPSARPGATTKTADSVDLATSSVTEDLTGRFVMRRTANWRAAAAGAAAGPTLLLTG